MKESRQPFSAKQATTKAFFRKKDNYITQHNLRKKLKIWQKRLKNVGCIYCEISHKNKAMEKSNGKRKKIAVRIEELHTVIRFTI